MTKHLNEERMGLNMTSLKILLQGQEAVTLICSLKKVFVKNSQSSQKSTCVVIRPTALLKTGSGIDIFTYMLRNLFPL